MNRPEKSNDAKHGVTSTVRLALNFEDTKQTSQGGMVEVKEVTYGKALLRQ